MAWRLRKNLDGADAMHFTSNLERDLVRKLRLRAPAIVEPNGVDLMEFQTLPPRGQFRNIHPELAGKPMLLFLSRLHYKKGLDLLVPALARARTRDAMLVIAGPDNDGYRAKVESMAREHGVLGRLLFPGMLYGQDRIAALADADLFVLPSYQENFGIAVVEALAAGTPVLISDQVNIFKEIFDAGVGGVVPTRVDALADELTRWMNDDALRATAAARTRAFVWARYNWQGIAQHWQECYRRLIAGHASRDDRMYANALSS